ncbi:MAG: PHA/PHB synthase family protein [Hyphomicrobium sp.]
MDQETSLPLQPTSFNPLVPINPKEIAEVALAPLLFPTNVDLAPSLSERDSYTSTALAELMDRATNAAIAKLTLGLSPASLMGAYLDWLTHLAASPGKRLQLMEKGFRKLARLQRNLLQCAFRQNGYKPCISPLPQDKRFLSDGWQRWPFNFFYQSHLLLQQWWHVATTDVPGVSAQNERMLEFTARQILDVFSPSNFIFTNPDVLDTIYREGGRNLLNGFQNWFEDVDRIAGGRPPVGAESFRPGHEVAITEGKVIYRNVLIELIQYSPSTPNVKPEPLLIIPAWIMKYYILDLSPNNSLIKYLVAQGFTVFTISWKNPDPESRDVGLDDYHNLGIMSALKAISAIIPNTKVHGVGYCLGGTLLAITAAALARDRNSPFKTLSFLAAQIDFTEPGELQLFMNESQLRFLEDMMWEQGFLDAKQMAGAFQMLRSNDLIWSRGMREYLLGKRTQMTDLTAWNADSTRMPYRMHSEYLRKFYLNNDLAEGRYEVDGKPITISDIRTPLFCVGTTKDHIAPWRSVYKWNQFADSNVTFVLTEGGHNAGIISEPGHKNRKYQIATREEHAVHMDPETWLSRTPYQNGSWWPAWSSWLSEYSSAPVKPPRIGAPEKGFTPEYDAPGQYIHET